MARVVKNMPAMQETRIRSLGWEGFLKKGMATHSSILACEIPWTEATVHGIAELDTTEVTLHAYVSQVIVLYTLTL